MARPRNEDLPVKMVLTCAILHPGTLPSVNAFVHRNEEFTVTRKEADALILFRFAEEVEADE